MKKFPKLSVYFFPDGRSWLSTEIHLRETNVAMVSMSVVYEAKIGNVRKAK